MHIKSFTLASALLMSISTSSTAQAAPTEGVPAALSKPASPPIAVTAPPTPAVSPGTKPVPAMVAPVPEASAAKVVTAAAAVTTAASGTSVLERFRTYAGPRTPAAMSALFNGPVTTGVRQQPEVVLSSGAAMVSLAATLPAKGSAAPSFAFNGARLISFEKTKKDEWLIGALPEAGVTKAELIVLSDGGVLEIPLVIAPPLPAATDLSESAFTAFLKGKDAAAKPLLDLNGDGRKDYVDDYIFTANFLVNKRSPVSERSTATEDPRATQAPSQSEPDYAQRIKEFQAAEAAKAAETKNPAVDQGAWQPSAGGYLNNASAPVVTPTPPVVSQSTPVTTPTTPGTTTNPPTTPVVTPTPKVGTYTISDGKTSLTYQGTSTPSDANMRNFRAKQLKNSQNP